MTELLVTYLVVTGPPRGPSRDAPRPGLAVRRERPDVGTYLALYRAIGGPQGWDLRTAMTEEALAEFLAAPATSLWLLRDRGRPAGFAEFDGLGGAEVELVHFGITPDLREQGVGGWFLDLVLRRVWLTAPGHVWLHTDTHDQPAAIPTYVRAGFQVQAQRLEPFDRIGTLPPPWRTAA